MDLEHTQEQQDLEQQQPPVDESLSPVGEGAASSTSTAPNETELLRQQIAQYESVLRSLEPHANRIKRIVEDPEAAAFFDESYSVYRERAPQREPELPPELKGLNEKVTRLHDYVERAERTERDRKEAEDRKRFDENVNYGKRLVSERPDLLEDDGFAIKALEGYVNEKHVTLEQAWKQIGTRFAKPVKQSAPPSSLRADAGEIGIPGRSDQQAPSTMSFREAFLHEYAKNRRQA